MNCQKSPTLPKNPKLKDHRCQKTIFADLWQFWHFWQLLDPCLSVVCFWTSDLAMIQWPDGPISDPRSF
jgi:hypothetical protein